MTALILSLLMGSAGNVISGCGFKTETREMCCVFIGPDAMALVCDGAEPVSIYGMKWGDR